MAATSSLREPILPPTRTTGNENEGRLQTAAGCLADRRKIDDASPQDYASNDMLPDLRVASPCSADWEKMLGDDRVRYCADCRLNVYNFSAMTNAEIQQLIASHEGRLCGRLYRRRDGTLLTRDCPRGLRVVVRRVSRVAGAILSAAMSVTLAAAQAKDKAASSLVQIDLHDAALAVTVSDPSGAVIGEAQVSLVNQATGIKSTGTTDQFGKLRLSSLAPGSYQLTVMARGFSKFGKMVSLSGESTMDVHLEIGRVSQGIIVSLPTDPSPVPDQSPTSDTTSKPARQ